MTTIAWDGKTLAADRKQTSEGIWDSSTTKIVKRKDGALCGAAGTAALAAALKRWFMAGEKGARPSLHIEKEDANGIIIRPNGKIIIHDFSGWYDVDTDKWATGSGWQLAIGAMHAGATAEEAVRIASKIDGRTGGDIDVLELGK